jgi:hypothetical protein
MTATEVVKRVDEKMLMLSPMLGRLMKEFLQPSISRTFNILVREGVIVVPEELKLKPYNIRYVSPLARAQKATETRAIAEYVDLIMGMSNAREDVLDTINFDKVSREVAKLEDIPPSILSSDDEIKTKRDERKEAELAQAQGGETIVPE